MRDSWMKMPKHSLFVITSVWDLLLLLLFLLIIKLKLNSKIHRKWRSPSKMWCSLPASPQRSASSSVLSTFIQNTIQTCTVSRKEIKIIKNYHIVLTLLFPAEEAQRKNRRDIDQQSIQPGNMRVWSDPFQPLEKSDKWKDLGRHFFVNFKRRKSKHIAMVGLFIKSALSSLSWTWLWVCVCVWVEYKCGSVCPVSCVYKYYANMLVYMCVSTKIQREGLMKNIE